MFCTAVEKGTSHFELLDTCADALCVIDVAHPRTSPQIMAIFACTVTDCVNPAIVLATLVHNDSNTGKADTALRCPGS